MRGRPKHSHHRQSSNKHYKQKLVQVLLDSGSDGNLVFINKNKPMLLPSSKKLVPQSWNSSNGMFQTKRKAEIELNYFEYSDSKRYLAEPDIVEYDKNNRPQFDLILGVKTMKKYAIILDFKDKMITVDEVKLPMRNIIYLQGSSTLRALKLNHSLLGRCRHCSGNYEARGASGGKYEARIVIFCILAAVDRFSRISRKAESGEENWKAVEESGKPSRKEESR
jgi:hypothetical protein